MIPTAGDDLVARLRGYNPPDRTIDEQRQLAQDIYEAADRIAALSAELAGVTTERDAYAEQFDLRAKEVVSAWQRAESAERQLAAAMRVVEAARDVVAERARQVSVEGWTPEHDDAHDHAEMPIAAAAYALSAANIPDGVRLWPWDKEWWKPTTPRRDLVKAGALILAEIERIDRADDE